MSTIFCFIKPAVSTVFNSIQPVLSRWNFDKVGKEVAWELKARKRVRKFRIFDYSIATIGKCNCDEAFCSMTLSHTHENYKFQAGIEIFDKCIHKNLDQEYSRRIIERITAQVLTVVGKCVARKIKREIKKYGFLGIQSLLKYLGVNDIVLIDGTEIPTSKGAVENLGINAKGRNTKEGETATPCLKLHVVFSLKKLTFDYVSLTGGADSEREWVKPENYSKTLFIMDAGYNSDELEERIEKSGNYFLIKARKSIAGTVLRSLDINGAEYAEHKGKKVKELMNGQDLDLTVKRKDGTKLRALIAFNPGAEEEDDKHVILRTNLLNDKVSHVQLFRLYRLRWTIEIFNKCLKSGNAMVGVNSLKVNIIVEMVLFSLIASLIKTYCGILAIGDDNIEKQSMLNLHTKFNVRFRAAVYELIDHGRSSISQVFKELVAYLSKHCLRAAPSKRDADKLKDQRMLTSAIQSPDGPKAEFTA